MKFGYDTESKFLFSWDKDFKFEGRVDAPPEGSFILPIGKKRYYEMVGCKFLSGLGSLSVVAWSDGDVISYLTCRYDDFGFVEADKEQNFCQYMAEKTRVSLCGPVCKDPQKVSEFCKRFPYTVNYVCPVVDELASFGVLAGGLRDVIPHRAFLYQPNNQKIDSESVEFNKDLEGDGYGRMAHLVSNKVAVLNEMMIPVGISPFFGKMIHDALNGSLVYIVRSASMNELFPKETISAKDYAATSVPVRMDNTEEFAKITGCSSQTVDIFVSSDYVLGLPDFIRCYMVMCGRPFVGTADARDIAFPQRKVPVFRYDRGYMISPENMVKYEASGILQS